MSDESNIAYRILPEIHTMKTYGASKEVITVLYYREDAYKAMKEKLDYALAAIAAIKTLASLSNNISRREDCYYIADEALKKIEGMG